MNTREHIDAGVDAYRDLIRTRAPLEAELLDSVPAFFGSGAAPGSAELNLLSARRHLEWFIFERHSPSLLGTPAERLLDDWRLQTRGDDPALERALLQSLTGVFEVTDVRAGEGVWLRDVTGFGEHPLDDPRAERFSVGDLLVGRLFPIEDGLYAASLAAGVFRSGTLKGALEQDLERAREGGGPKVLRLAQHELERMFWGAGQVAAPADPLGDARKLLGDAGFDAARVERTLARLKSTPFAADRLVHGADDVLSELLDELAFESRIDLGRARALLLHAWAAASGVIPARPAPIEEDGSRDTRAAVDAFAAARAAGGDLDALIGDLERNLGLDDDDEDDEEDTPAPDFPGVVAAVIEEFRWELAQAAGDAPPETHATLAQLAHYAEHIGVFEELDAAHLLRFTCFWLHERSALRDAADARALVASLGTFCKWVEAHHEHPLATEFGPVLETLAHSLPRVVELNGRVAAATDDQGELFEIDTLAAAGDVLRDRSREEHHVRLPDALRADLCVDDRLRGNIALDGAVTVYRVYPPEAAGLSAD